MGTLLRCGRHTVTTASTSATFEPSQLSPVVTVAGKRRGVTRQQFLAFARPLGQGFVDADGPWSSSGCVTVLPDASHASCSVL